MNTESLIHFEDLSPGMSFPLGPRSIDRDEVLAFAAEYDPQPMHLDEEAGKASMLGGLGASGWHTCAMMMRMMWESYISRMAAEGAPGIDFVKWKRPVLVGDVLSGQSRILACRPSKSRPAIGIVSFRHELSNQHGKVVIESENPVMIRRRPSGEVAQ